MFGSPSLASLDLAGRQPSCRIRRAAPNVFGAARPNISVAEKQIAFRPLSGTNPKIRSGKARRGSSPDLQDIRDRRYKKPSATSPAIRSEFSAKSVIPGLNRLTGRYSGRSKLISSESSTGARFKSEGSACSAASAPFDLFCMTLLVEHSLTIVNGTKDPARRSRKQHRLPACPFPG